jgi:hypothetical protein
VYQLHDVIFEEGMLHRTHLAEPEEESLPQDLSIFEAGNLPQPPQPDNPNIDTALPDPPALDVPDLPRHSERAPKPTRTLLDIQASSAMEAAVKAARKDWARNSRRPTANTVDIGWEMFDDTLLRNPWAFASSIKGSIPRSYRDAMREPEKWMPPMQAEFNQLEDRGVWKRVDLPPGEHAIDGMWVYDLKVDSDGNVVKRKARYVARGDEMVEGKEFEVKWVMVARMESVRMVFAVAAVDGLQVRRWDFSGAYLNGKTDRPVYMK